MTNTPGDPETPWVRPDQKPADTPGNAPTGPPVPVTREVSLENAAPRTRDVPAQGGAEQGGGVPPDDLSAPSQDGRTREVPRPLNTAAELPMLTRELLAPDATSARPGPWDSVVAPFTMPPTRHDRSALPNRANMPVRERPMDPGGRPPAGGPPPGPPPPGGRSSDEKRRRTTIALVAAGGAIVVAAAVALAFGQLGGSYHPQAGCAGQTCSQRTNDAAAPKLRYRTVERDVGYFEGTVTLVNRGRTPMRAWTLSFTYPGADIRNAWDVQLRQKGQNVVIAGAPTAEPIAPGEGFEVRFGGSGRPGTPTNCRLNGAPCAFVR